MYREMGPNGYPVGCNDEGDLIELIDDGEGICANVFFRSEENIAAALAELTDRVLRDAHRMWLEGEFRLLDEIDLTRVKTLLEELDARYGRENPQDDFEYGFRLGKLQALIWVEGGEWGSVDDLFRDDDCPYVIRRSRERIFAEQEMIREKVWWNRHQNWLWCISNGTDGIGCEKVFAAAKKSARRIERKYGKKNLGWSDYEWGIINGQLSALRWILGFDWDMLDT